MIETFRRNCWCKRTPCLAATALFLAATGAAYSQQLERTFLKGPYLQAPGDDTMTILWESPTNKPGTLHYGLNGRLNRALHLPSPRTLSIVTTNSITNVSAGGKTNVTKVALTNFAYLYEMTLAKLRPNSTYSYSAETDGVRTPPKRFRTFGSSPNKVTFIAYGDTRTNPKIHAAVAVLFKRHNPNFILHTGDLVTDGKVHAQWGREFFAPLANVIDEIPILPAIGNHEQDGLNYLHYLHLPGKERWYSYDVGPVHLLSLDYRYEKETEEQFQFARKDLLTSQAPWKVVFLHYPVFNIGGHNTGWGHASYLPLFHQAKVDLVIAGHSHVYERFRPVAGTSNPDTWPITHITTGGGGAPLYVTYTHPALMAWATTNHYVVIDATLTSLKGRAITTNQVVIDAFELRKPWGRPAASYLAQTYPEDFLKLSFEVGPLLTASLTARPGTNSPVKAMFTLRPMKNATHPVDLEIGLTPESALTYEIVGGPVRVTTPSATDSNKVAWASLRATGRRAIVAQGRDRVLSPNLIFQAKVFSGSLDSIAYGQRSKITDAAAKAATNGVQVVPSE
ncbi:MAG: metallophosphoesterase [Verrucomicrobia bacterium]|nr:metallophosphoesterase [Verrucomicrobiota bacterium]